MTADTPFHVTGLLRKCGFNGPFDYTRLNGGANNRVFKLESEEIQLVVKEYFRHPDDPRDRLAAEYNFLKYSWSIGLRCTPEPLGADWEHGLGLYRFVKGIPLNPEDVNTDRVEEAAQFIRMLNSETSKNIAGNLKPASEACFSPRQHLYLIERRILRLGTVEDSHSNFVEFSNFVSNDLKPAWRRVRNNFQEYVGTLGNRSDQEMPVSQRIVSPSDFGFHNSLISSSRKLIFLDFEYAGWDDPAKLICDFFCQPQIPVSNDHFDLFVSTMLSDAENPESTIQRAKLIWPLYCLKWCCICLNEMLTDGKLRREFAGSETLDNAEKSERILNQIRNLLAKALVN